MKKKKRPFTLLETALAFSILAIILVFLFTTLRSSVSLSAKIETARHLIFSRYHLHERLTHIFSTMEECLNIHLENAQAPCYTALEEKGLALYFIFNYGVDPDKALTGPVQGKLYLHENSLFLDVFSLNFPQSTPLRHEKLFSHISSFKLVFHERPLPTSAEAKTQKNLFQRSEEWLASTSTLPYAITIDLDVEKASKISYTFFLSSKVEPIHYEL